MTNIAQSGHLARHAISGAAAVGIVLLSAAALGQSLPQFERAGAYAQTVAAGEEANCLPVRIAALSTEEGPLGCGEDGVCNLAQCAKDPDCPEGVTGNTNHPSGGPETLFLNIQFAITEAAGPDAASQSAAKLKIAAWIAEAEKIYAREPALKINPSYRYHTVNVPTTFKNFNEAHKFLKDHYDNIVGDTKTEGALVVAVTAEGSDLTHSDKTTCDDGGFGGLSFYPDSIDPFGRKHGIALSLQKADGSFAHELGHMFGLEHTFDGSYGLAENCNKNFSKSEGGTRDGSKINLMDHGLEDGDQLWLNECQKDKAADHRKRLRTSDGKTNYGKL